MSVSLPTKSLSKQTWSKQTWSKQVCALTASQIRRLFLMMLAGWITLNGFGCANKGLYRASKLPREFHAPLLSNAQTVDLSRFGNAVQSADIIGKGDVIEVAITAGLGKDDIFTFPARVSDSGDVNLPHIGEIHVLGLELESAETAIAAASIETGVYRNPHVTVTMKRRHANHVTVVGAVKNPGIYELPSGSSDLLAALVSAGGLSDQAGTEVEIRNPAGGSSIEEPDRIANENGEFPQDLQLTGLNETIAEPGSFPEGVKSAAARRGSSTVKIDLASFGSDQPDQLKIRDGAVVMVEKRSFKPIHILGLVTKPGKYDYPLADDLRLLDAVSLAQGISNPLADKIYIIRHPEGSNKPILIQASLNKAKQNADENLRLGPGDVVSIEKTPQTVIMDAVRLIGFNVGGAIF